MMLSKQYRGLNFQDNPLHVTLTCTVNNYAGKSRQICGPYTSPSPEGQPDKSKHTRLHAVHRSHKGDQRQRYFPYRQYEAWLVGTATAVPLRMPDMT